MSVELASAGQPSGLGSTGSKWAVEEQHWVRLFNTVPEVPIWIRLIFLAIPVLVYVNGCVEGNAKDVTWCALLNP